MTTLSVFGGVFGCAPSLRVPEPAVHTGAPHISWAVGYGGNHDDTRNKVCQSDPLRACAMAARKADVETFAHVDLYFHPAKVETTYTGTVDIGFFDGPASAHRVTVKTTVRPKDDPHPQGVSDLLTTEPGTYRMAINLVGTPKSGEETVIRQNVKVVVE